MSYRVIQWATGNVGKAAIEGVLGHPDLELAGCWVHSADKHGRDVGEICGGEPVGVLATSDRDEILALDADCVVYSPVLADPNDVAALLASGKNVVTPVGWVYPFAADRVLAMPADEAIEAACHAGNATLHGTGIHPGGITERFPLMLSSLCTGIEHVTAEEFSDIRSYATEFVVREIMMFGKPPEVAQTSAMPKLLGQGFCQSIDMVAAELGVTLDPEKRISHEWAVATAPIATPVGVLEPGTVAAQRFAWEGTVDGEPVISARVNWLMGEEHLDPAWTFGPEGQRFEVRFDATPPVHVTFHGVHPPRPEDGLVRNPGIVATAMHCVNAIPYVCDAEAGIKTYLDLPLIAGRLARR
ncbi:MAG TPA: dihydrodipicolinate reductase [Acidimicrobiia bacterium]|jgi:hypothetical protein